jgi:hypothetical protein
MLRRLYRCAVRLHPSGFRRRFGDEMLYIFDQQSGLLAELSVTLDCVLSLLRQWTLRARNGAELPADPLPGPTADHVPLFETLGTFQPRPSAIINGAVLSAILFCMTVIGIRYSWSHVLNLHIREIGTDWEQVAPVPARPAHSALIQLDPYVGEYTSKSPSVKISVRIEGDHLSLSFSKPPSLVLSPVSAKRFVIDGIAENYVDFTPDVRGGICCLSLVISGKVITAQRQ